MEWSWIVQRTPYIYSERERDNVAWDGPNSVHKGHVRSINAVSQALSSVLLRIWSKYRSHTKIHVSCESACLYSDNLFPRSDSIQTQKHTQIKLMQLVWTGFMVQHVMATIVNKITQFLQLLSTCWEILEAIWSQTHAPLIAATCSAFSTIWAAWEG